MKGKPWKIILATSTILSGVGNVIKIYEISEGINMKIDVAWLILAIIFIFSIFILIYSNYRSKRDDYEDFRMSTLDNVRKLILRAEGIEQEPIIKWLTYHSSNYKRQKFDNLEQKINYLIDVKLHGDEDKPQPS